MVSSCVWKLWSWSHSVFCTSVIWWYLSAAACGFSVQTICCVYIKCKMYYVEPTLTPPLCLCFNLCRFLTTSRPASKSRTESVCASVWGCVCLRVPSLTAAGARWKDTKAVASAAAGAESRRGQDDVGSGGIRPHGDPAAVQQRWRQQPLGRRRLGQREQLSSPVWALKNQSPRR